MMSKTTKDLWLKTYKPSPQARLRLFCFPYAGGSAAIFRFWSESLPKLVEVCPIQLPGRGDRMHEPLFTRIQPLIRSLAPAVLPYLDKPFAFFGHSLGAVIAYELALNLREEYRLEPLQLFVSGRRAPHILSDEPDTYNLPEPEFVEELRRLNGTPIEVLEQPELLQLIIPLLRADFELVQTYRYIKRPPLSCPIMGFAGLQDDHVKVEDVQEWRSHTSTSFTLQKMLGGHFFIQTAQSMLLNMLSRKLGDITETVFSTDLRAQGKSRSGASS